MLYFFWHLYLVGEFFAVALFIDLTTRDPLKKRHRFVANTTRISKKFRKAFRLNLRVLHPERLEAMRDKNYLAVCNHVSYTDIILLSSLENFVFITSVEMGNNPFLGSITRKGGCLFTNRKKFVSLPKEIEKFALTITQGFKVMLFPEGTSTNGDTVREFRKSLFQTALIAKCPVLPLCIRYKRLDGKDISLDNRDLLYWYGDMEFAPHFMKLVGRRVDVEIDILEFLPYHEEITRQELSEQVYTQIHTNFHEGPKTDSQLTDQPTQKLSTKIEENT